ncbi:SPFH domain-containing protein [Streptomyces sp. O3]
MKPGLKPGAGPGAREEAAARGGRLIQNEATTEIPVHLLFRDDTGPVPVPLAPTVVGRRHGTGEQPRVGRTPRPGPARPAPPVDGEIVERPGAAVPGAVAAATGAAGLGGCAAGLWWAGVVPPLAALTGYPGAGLGPAQWAVLAGSGATALFAFGGLGRGRVGRAWVLSLFGRYRGSVRRTGLVWINPLLKRRRLDVRLRHWRSDPLPAMDADGAELQVTLLVVWRIEDTARATYAVEDYQTYLRQCVEAAMARVFSRLPADAFHGDGPTLRDTESVGDALTRMLAADVRAAGIEVFSVQPTRIEYTPEVARLMRHRRVAALDARHRETALSQLVDSVEDTVTRLTGRGLVELDDYERKALVKDLTVAFYTGHGDR